MTSDVWIWDRTDTIRWVAALAVIGVDMLWLLGSGRAVDANGLVGWVEMLLVIGCSGGGMALLASRTVGHRLPALSGVAGRMQFRRLALAQFALLWIFAFVFATGILSYLLVTLSPPLIDNQLLALDTALGFDWPAVHGWVRARPGLTATLDWFYKMGRLQLLLIPVLAALAGRDWHLREYLTMVGASLCLLFLVSAPFPAQGAFQYFAAAGYPISAEELRHYSHFFVLRSGEMRVFNPETMQGLVSMPSFHTAMGLIFIQAMRWSRVGLLVAVPFNTIMILATPTQGGHYFSDVIAGAMLWAVSAALVRYLSRRGAAAVHGPLVPLLAQDGAT